MTPDWMKTCKIGDRIVCIRSIRDVAVGGRVYVVSGFLTHRNMRSDHGLYDIGLMVEGDRRTVYDPRSFRPLEFRPTDISVFTNMLVRQTEPA